MNNLKKERTLFKNVEWNDGEQKRKDGENALNIGAASRSHRIHSILFCLLSIAKWISWGGGGSSQINFIQDGSLLLADVSMTNTLNF